MQLVKDLSSTPPVPLDTSVVEEVVAVENPNCSEDIDSLQRELAASRNKILVNINKSNSVLYTWMISGT